MLPGGLGITVSVDLEVVGDTEEVSVDFCVVSPLK